MVNFENDSAGKPEFMGFRAFREVELLVLGLPC